MGKRNASSFGGQCGSFVGAWRVLVGLKRNITSVDSSSRNKSSIRSKSMTVDAICKLIYHVYVQNLSIIDEKERKNDRVEESYRLDLVLLEKWYIIDAK